MEKRLLHPSMGHTKYFRTTFILKFFSARNLAKIMRKYQIHIHSLRKQGPEKEENKGKVSHVMAVPCFPGGILASETCVLRPGWHKNRRQVLGATEAEIWNEDSCLKPGLPEEPPKWKWVNAPLKKITISVVTITMHRVGSQCFKY